MKYIFVDLDETLFHARFLSGNRRKAERMTRNDEKLIELDTEFYGSCLRPGALDFLAKLRAIPNSRVLVLTSSVTDYANANNVTHGLGFMPDQIFARDRLQARDTSGVDVANPKTAEMVMIDNLPRQENRIKVWWLNDLTQNPVRYVKVPEFMHPSLDRHFDEALIAETVSRVINADPTT